MFIYEDLVHLMVYTVSLFQMRYGDWKWKMAHVTTETHLGCFSIVITPSMGADTTMLICAPSGHRMKH